MSARSRGARAVPSPFVVLAHNTWGVRLLLHPDQFDASVIVRIELARHVPPSVLAFALDELSDVVRRAPHARDLETDLVGELIDLARYRRVARR